MREPLRALGALLPHDRDRSAAVVARVGGELPLPLALGEAGGELLPAVGAGADQLVAPDQPAPVELALQGRLGQAHRRPPGVVLAEAVAGEQEVAGELGVIRDRQWTTLSSQKNPSGAWSRQNR